jgi:probable F420-dependent oxidoreductase
LKFGVVTFPTEYSIGPAELARAMEERGFESLFFPEHTHIPASRRTPWPGGAELPKEYSHTLDPFLALTAAAAATQRLLVGTGICLVVERDPIVLAKEVATLDLLSGGRFLFGVGAGWNIEEMENHGTDPASRFRLFRERVLAMKAIWADDEAEHHGELVDFDRLWSWPKPVQKPNPPILVGGAGRPAFRRVVEFGDGWMPIPRRGGPPLSEQIAELNAMAAAAGRGPVPVTVYGAPPRAEVIRHYQESGVERCVFWLPTLDAGQLLPMLDRQAELIAELA